VRGNECIDFTMICVLFVLGNTAKLKQDVVIQKSTKLKNYNDNKYFKI